MVISLFSLLTENNYDNIIRSAHMFKVSLLTLDESKQISPQGSVSHDNLNVSPPLLNQYAMKFSSLIFLYISAIHQKSHTVIQHKAFISSLRHSIVSLVWNRSQQFRSPQNIHWFTAEDYSHYTTHTHTYHHQSFWLEGLCFSEVMEDQCWLHGIIIWGIRLAYLSTIELSHWMQWGGLIKDWLSQ